MRKASRWTSKPWDFRMQIELTNRAESVMISLLVHRNQLLLCAEALEFCHLNGHHSAFIAFVTQASTTSVFGLLQVVGGEQTVNHGDIAGRIQACNAVGDAFADVVEMRRLAPNDAS